MVCNITFLSDLHLLCWIQNSSFSYIWLCACFAMIKKNNENNNIDLRRCARSFWT